MKHIKKGFTLVELMVVVVILSVLATVGFISYEAYLVDTRDSKRLAQITGLRDGLRLATTKWSLPIPDDAVEIRNNSTTFLYQWYAWEDVLNSISYSDSTVDPLDETYYTYMLSDNRKDFQIMWFLEKYNQDVISLNTQSVFAAVNYSQRFPNTVGKKLWILLQQQTNTPLQEIPEYAGTGFIDLQNPTTNLFDAYITDTYIISWKENDLIWIIPYTTCKKIANNGGSYGNGIYNINPTGLNPFEVYCDMEIDGGWWTLIWRSHESAAPNDFWWLSKRGTVRDNNSAYSLWVDSIETNFSEIMISSYSSWKNISYAAKTSVDRSYYKNTANYKTFSRWVWCTEVFPVTSWRSPCDATWVDGKATEHSALVFWWFFNYSGLDTVNDSHFYFDHFARNSPTLFYWLYANGWNKETWDGLGELFWKQGMVFVR